LPSGGTGTFAFDTFPVYENSAHSSGIAVNATTLAVYSAAAAKWLTVGLTDTLDPALITYSATLTITDASATGDTFTLNSVAYDYTDSPVSVSNLPTDTEAITYTGSNTGACTGDVTGTGPWSITGDAASVDCSVSVATTSVTDDFDRADGALGSNWTTHGVATPAIITNVVYSGTSNTVGYANYSGAAFNDDQYAQVSIASTGSDSSGATCRMDSSGNGYAAVCTNSTTCSLYLVTSGSRAYLQSSYVTVSDITNKTLKITCDGQVITGYLDGIAFDSKTDTTYTTGSPGLTVRNNWTKGVDNFEAGNL
jgi:hypothetical protein